MLACTGFWRASTKLQARRSGAPTRIARQRRQAPRSWSTAKSSAPTFPQRCIYGHRGKARRTRMVLTVAHDKFHVPVVRRARRVARSKRLLRTTRVSWRALTEITTRGTQDSDRRRGVSVGAPPTRKAGDARGPFAPSETLLNTVEPARIGRFTPISPCASQRDSYRPPRSKRCRRSSTPGKPALLRLPSRPSRVPRRRSIEVLFPASSLGKIEIELSPATPSPPSSPLPKN